MNYADILEHVDAGKTAAQIEAILQADTRHVRDVMATSGNADDTDLLDVLGEFGLLYIKPDATWGGPLVTAVEAANNPALTAGFSRLLMNLQITNRPVRCGTDPAIGYLVTVLTGLAMQSVPAKAAEIQAAMNSLTGGLRFAGVDGTAVQALINRHSVNAIWQAKQSVVEQGIFDGSITTIEQIVAAIGGK